MKKFLRIVFHFSNSQKIGLLLLFAVIFIMQFFIFYVNFSVPLIQNEAEKQKWLSFQTEIDSLKQERTFETPKI